MKGGIHEIIKKISLIIIVLLLVVGIMIIKDDKPSKTLECLEDAFNENNYGVKIIDEDGDAIMDNYTQNDYYLSVANLPIED